jgi:hypothetical protein
MFAVRLDFSMPSSQARYSQHELRGADWIITRTRHEGAVLDEAFSQPTAAHESWGRIRIVLDGEVLVRRADGEVVLRSDEGIASPTWTSEPSCALTPTCEWVDMHWRYGSALGERLTEGGAFRLPKSGRVPFLEVTEALSLGDAHRAQRAAFETLDVLRASGLPFGLGAARIANGVSNDAHAFAYALENTVNRLADQPMAVDLAKVLGVGERQALRRANDHFRAFHLTVTSWREYMIGVRLAMGAFFGAAPGARTETVSKVAGFGSPVSFCHALHAAGLPSPQVLQRRFREVVGSRASAA